MAKKKLTKGRIARMEEKARKEKQRKRNIIIISIGVVLLLAAIVVGIVLAVKYSSKALEYYAEIKIKDKGTIVVALDNENAPKAVAKFMELAKNGTYDGSSFYELASGKLFGGNKEADVSHILGEFENGLTNQKGVISMKRTGLTTVNPALFFVNMQDNPEYDNDAVEFGVVTSGLDILENFDISDGKYPIIEKITIKTK